MGQFSEIPSYMHHEGNRWIIEQEDGTRVESSYEEVSAGFSIKTSDAPTLTADQIRTKLDEVAQEMARQQFQHMMSTITASAQHIQDESTYAPRKLTKEVFLDALRRITVSFRENGEIDPPSIIMHPDLWEKIKDDVATWENDPEFKRQHEQIIQQKREEWRARESNRKLVE